MIYYFLFYSINYLLFNFDKNNCVYKYFCYYYFLLLQLLLQIYCSIFILNVIFQEQIFNSKIYYKNI